MSRLRTCGLALAALACFTSAARANLDAAIDATCRLTAGDGSRGTGCVFEIGQGYVYILTAGHVVEKSSTVACEFWHRGYQSAAVEGRVSQRANPAVADAAIVVVEVAQLGGVLPSVVPLAPADYQVAAGQPLVSVGCAGGAWSTGWKGHVLRLESDALRFVPPPAQGRSGSALFDEEGRHIVGIVEARTIDNQEGIAVPLAAIYRAFRRPTSSAETTDVQCGPNGCPMPSYRLLPYRQQQEYQQYNRANPWPTLPPATGSSVDLGETNRKLDRIAELLARRDVPEARPEPAKTPEAAEKTAQEAQRTAAQVKDEQSKLREGLSSLHDIVGKLTGDVTSLPQRFQERIEKVKAEGAEGTREIARAYVHDLVSEKLADGTLGMSLGKVLGGALGLSGPLGLAVAGGLWLVSKSVGSKLQSGEPLLVQQAFSHVASAIEDLRARLARSETKSPTS